MDTTVGRPLYTAHPQALNVLFAELESYAFTQQEAFVGTGGSVVERENASGFRFYAHQFYDGDGKKRERYLGGFVEEDIVHPADALRSRIEELKTLVPSLRMLGREGYSLVDAKTYATLASLHNHGVFAAGAILVGSHAYGVLLNRLGIRAATYSTEDIDIARLKALTFEQRPTIGLIDMLKDSGIEFLEVPELDRKTPSTSFKQRGRSSFHVDLLAPSRDETYSTIAVPELKAHATRLPYLGYLLEESQLAMIAARQGCCAVRVPLPEYFAIHKFIVSRLRTGRNAKAGKDVQQACVLSAALAEMHPGALASAIAKVPRRARAYVKLGIEAGRRTLARYPRALEELTI